MSGMQKAAPLEGAGTEKGGSSGCLYGCVHGTTLGVHMHGALETQALSAGEFARYIAYELMVTYFR